MKITAQLVASILSADLEGDPEIEILGPGRIDEAKKGDISFLSNLKYEKYLYVTNASVVLVNKSFTPSKPVSVTLIKVDNVDESLLKLMQHFSQIKKAKQCEIHTTAIVDETAQIGKEVSIGAYAVIGKNVVIGDNTTIGNHVTIDEHTTIAEHTRIDAGVRIYHSTEIGKHCVIKANTVIGGEGFRYARADDKSYERVPHLGKVILHDYVELGSSVTVDRGSIGDTILNTGVKIDNLVQIAHNVEIGAHTAIAAQAGMAGSCKVGPYCMVGGQAALVGHIQIASDVMIQGQSGIAKSIKEPGSKWYGTPALPYNQYLRAYSVFKKLPELQKEIRESKN